MGSDSDTDMVVECGSDNDSNQNLNQTNENFSEGTVFGTPDSEFLDSPILHPTADPPSPDWFLTLSDSSERQQEIIENRNHNGPQTNHLNAVSDRSYHGFTAHETSVLSSGHLFVSSSGSAGFESSPGSAGSTLDSVQGGEFYAQQTGSPLNIPEPEDLPFLDLFMQEESIPANGNNPLQVPYSEYEIYLVQQNQSFGQFNGEINFSDHDELLLSQIETLSLGHNAMIPNQFGTTNGFNGNSHDMLYPNGFPQNTTSGMGFQNGTPNTWLPNYPGDLYGASAASGYQMNPMAAVNSFPLQNPNTITPGSSTFPRPMDSNNQQQQLNQVQPMSNGTNNNYPYSIQPNQQNQVPMEQGRYQGNMLPETNMPLRPPVLPQLDQLNQGLNGANFMMPNPYNSANSNIMMQEPQMPQRPQQFPNQQQMVPNLPNPQNYNNGFLGANHFPRAANHPQMNQVPNGPNMNGFPFQNPFQNPSRMQMQQQTMMNQATRTAASYPGPRAPFPGYILDTSAAQLPNGFNDGPPIPPQMGQTNGNGMVHNNGTDALRGQGRGRTGLGESSSPFRSFRRFRHECYASPRYPNLAVPPPPGPPTVPNPRPVRNSLYDPAFESLGLAVDPHLRMLNLEPR